MKKDKYSRIRILMEYFKVFGTIGNIRQDTIFKGEQIGMKVANLRRDKDNLSIEIVELLDYMGMNWNGQDIFKKVKPYLLAWYFKHKTLSNLTQYSKMEYDGMEIDMGEMLLNIRRAKRNEVLTDAQIEFLDNLGIIWAPHDKYTAYASLVYYKKVHGTIANITTNEVFLYEGIEYRVGRQVNHLRERYNKGLLDEDEIEFYEDLGMCWVKRNRKNESEREQKDD